MNRTAEFSIIRSGFPKTAVCPCVEAGNCVSVEPTTGVEPVNLFLTKEVLYLLSYVGLST